MNNTNKNPQQIRTANRRDPLRSAFAAAVGLTVLAGMLVTATPAAVAVPPPSCDESFNPASSSYIGGTPTATSTPVLCLVPSNVTSYDFVVRAGYGGSSVSPYVGGLGAKITGNFTVAPGSTLRIAIAGNGTAALLAGARVPGAGGTGGGASAIAKVNGSSFDIITVAGGGGGAGAFNPTSTAASFVAPNTWVSYQGGAGGAAGTNSTTAAVPAAGSNGSPAALGGTTIGAGQGGGTSSGGAGGVVSNSSGGSTAYNGYAGGGTPDTAGTQNGLPTTPADAIAGAGGGGVTGNGGTLNIPAGWPIANGPGGAAGGGVSNFGGGGGLQVGARLANALQGGGAGGGGGSSLVPAGATAVNTDSGGGDIEPRVQLIAATFLPDTPGAPVAEILSSNSVRVTVTPATTGVMPTSYTVTATPGSQTCTVTGASGSCVITLSPVAGPYTFTAQAQIATGGGTSAASAASNSITMDAPGLPGTPFAVAGVNSAAVTVVASPSSSGSPASYTVTATPGSQTCTVAATASPLTCLVGNLVPGTSYTFKVKATNAFGTSNDSNASNAITPLAPSPGPNPAPQPSSDLTPTPTPTQPAAPVVVVDPLNPVLNVANPNIPAGGLPAGRSVFLVNGEPVALTVTPNAKADPIALVIRAPSVTPALNMRLEGRGDDSDPLGLTGKQILILQSQPVTRTRANVSVQPVALSSGDGFKASSEVKFFLLPNVYLGALPTDASGAYKGSVPLPPGLTPGTYTLQVNGFAPDNSVRSLSIGVVVKQKDVTKAKTFKAAAKVFFTSLSTELSVDAKKSLNAIAKKVGKGAVRSVVVGFVQPTTGTSNDQSLSTQRAKVVAAYLKSRGVSGKFLVRGDGVAKQTDGTARRVNVNIAYRR